MPRGKLPIAWTWVPHIKAIVGQTYNRRSWLTCGAGFLKEQPSRSLATVRWFSPIGIPVNIQQKEVESI